MAISSILIKLDPELKRDFETMCARHDTTTTHAIRGLMRRFVEEKLDEECSRIFLEAPRADGGVVKDARTGMLFSANEPEEVVTLKRLRRLLNEFERKHPGVRLVPYEEREEAKQRGLDLQRAGASLDDRIRGFEMVMGAHFSRSAMDSLDSAKPFSYMEHPGLLEFASHYVAASSKDFEGQSELQAALQAKYPPPEGELRIASDSSYWR